MSAQPKNPEIADHVFIVEGNNILGEPVKFARGFCAGIDDKHRNVSLDFNLSRGEQWKCPECGRVYSFDGDRVDVTDPVLD